MISLDFEAQIVIKFVWPSILNIGIKLRSLYIILFTIVKQPIEQVLSKSW